MNRTIKFRAWDVINKVMYPIAFPTWNGMTEGKRDFVSHAVEVIEEDGDDHPVLMQLTGLHDKNGKEIFEGDVVWWHVNDITRTAPVYYDDVCACFWMGNDKDGGYLVLNDWLRGEYEVLGNIYENPELLAASP